MWGVAGRPVTATLAAVLLLAGVGACTTQPPLPDRSRADVKELETRLAGVIEDDPELLAESMTCRVRLLRHELAADFVWATCTSRDSSGSGLSVPMRIVGRRVTMPGDGTDYARDIRRMFPQDLIDDVLAGGQDVRP